MQFSGAVRHPAVLLVDDDPTLREFLSFTLGLHGFQVDAVPTCLDAIKKLARGCYDSILLDLVLPDSSGIFFYYRIKRLRPELAHKIIFMTGAIERYPQLGALQGEGRPLLLKPIRLSEIVAALQACVQAEPHG